MREYFIDNLADYDLCVIFISIKGEMNETY